MIYLITPTGARPQQIIHCAEWMKNQTYTGDVTWIIIDDCLPLTTDFITENFKDNWKIIKIYPKPAWQRGMNTQSRNISAGIDIVSRIATENDVIFIIEDDDYYTPSYLTKMVKKLEGYDIAGEMFTFYYNIIIRRYTVCRNTWSSLFQTAFTPAIIPILEKLYGMKFIDMELFKLVNNKNLFKDEYLAIGIKGQPGRAAVGRAHGRIMSWTADPELKKLRSLIGEDVNYYLKYYGMDFRSNILTGRKSLLHRK